MTTEPSANGADRRDPSQRPDWYVPITTVKDDDRTVQELLTGLTVEVNPGDIPDDLRAELVGYLNQFRAPRSTP